MKTPKDVMKEWVAGYNVRDAKAIADLYHEDAINHQVAGGDPVRGREAIERDLTSFFEAFPDNYTRIENLFQDGEWAMLEWSGGGTMKGELWPFKATGRSCSLRGCGFFHIVDGKIKFQRGYWDKLSWFSQLGLPVT